MQQLEQVWERSSALSHHEALRLILDFGLAAMKSEIPRLKKVSGTPAHMSPDQIQTGTIENRSDIYAVGLVLRRNLLKKIGGAVRDSMVKQRKRSPSKIVAFNHVDEKTRTVVFEIAIYFIRPSFFEKTMSID